MTSKSRFNVTSGRNNKTHFSQSYINAAPFVKGITKPNSSIKPYDIYEDEHKNYTYIKESLKMTSLLDRIFGLNNRGFLNRLAQESAFDLKTSMITEEMDMKTHSQRFTKRHIF